MAAFSNLEAMSKLFKIILKLDDGDVIKRILVNANRQELQWEREWFHICLGDLFLFEVIEIFLWDVYFFDYESLHCLHLVFQFLRLIIFWQLKWIDLKLAPIIIFVH